MSDPLTNVEIDDVLSSIRRLVSEHPEKTPHEARGKLVLTPALRVMDTPTNSADKRPAAAPAAPGTATGVTHPDQPAPGPVPGWTAEASASDAQTLEQRIAELEQAVAASAGEWEPDGTEEGAGNLPPDMPPVFTATSPAGARAWTDTARPETAGSQTAAPQDDSPRTTARTPGPQAETPPRADRAEDGGASVFEDDREEAILDEEMLRDMVAEFVREELQGALGERITRNVRKLVRAEIQRALAARDLG